MVQFKRALNSIFSNQGVGQVPVLKHLLTQGPDGTGMKNAHEVVKGSWKGMGRTGNADKKLADTIAKNNKEIDSINKGTTKFDSDADKAAALQALQTKNKKLEGSRQFYQERQGQYQDSLMSDGVMGYGKSAWNYVTAADMKGQQGRFMAAAVRNGAIGAGYMGAMTGVRALTGGGLTYNNTGERDIAGIPFI